MGIFDSFSTKRKLKEVELELELLQKRFGALEQEWDATSARVSKVLRRMARQEQAADQAGDGAENGVTLPEGALTPSPGRLERIRQQLAARRKEE